MAHKYLLLIATICAVAASTPFKIDSADLVDQNNDMEAGIIGGKLIAIEKANYMAAILTSKGDIIAGGTILNNRWILSSAARFYNQTKKNIQIRLGSSHSNKGGHIYQVDKFFIPDNYQMSTDYNVGLAKLKTPIKFSSSVGSISITDSVLPKEGTKAELSGYGTASNNQENVRSGSLAQVSLPVLHYNTCKPKMDFTFSDLSFCTAVDGKGPCTYDFGSPLVYKNKVIGVFSTESGCGSARHPAAFTDVYKLQRWIKVTMKKNTEEGELIEYSENDYNTDEE